MSSYFSIQPIVDYSGKYILFKETSSGSEIITNYDELYPLNATTDVSLSVTTQDTNNDTIPDIYSIDIEVF